MENEVVVVKPEQLQPTNEQQSDVYQNVGLVNSNVGMIKPAGTIEEALEQFNLYQEVREKLGNDNDFQEIGGKKHPKKSFVRKVQRFFNISCEIIQDEPLKDEKGRIIAWLAKARAIHLGTGAFQEADGSCSFSEKVGKTEEATRKMRTIHNIRSHAITRAKNRAILDLVGFGEVSAEEINEGVIFEEQSSDKHKAASDKQINFIKGLFKRHNLDDDKRRKLIKKLVGKEDILINNEHGNLKVNVSKDEASRLIERLQTMKTEEILRYINSI